MTMILLFHQSSDTFTLFLLVSICKHHKPEISGGTHHFIFFLVKINNNIKTKNPIPLKKYIYTTTIQSEETKQQQKYMHIYRNILSLIMLIFGLQGLFPSETTENISQMRHVSFATGTDNTHSQWWRWLFSCLQGFWENVHPFIPCL